MTNTTGMAWIQAHMDADETHYARCRGGLSRKTAKVTASGRDISALFASAAEEHKQRHHVWLECMAKGQTAPSGSRYLPFLASEHPAMNDNVDMAGIVRRLLDTNTALVDRCLHFAERTISEYKAQANEIRDLSVALVAENTNSGVVDALKVAMPALVPAGNAMLIAMQTQLLKQQVNEREPSNHPQESDPGSGGQPTNSDIPAP